TGFAQNAWGFHWGFGLAAVGMVGALIQYVASMHKLPSRAGTVQNPLDRYHLWLPITLAIGASALIAIASLTGYLRAENLSSIVTIIALLAAAGYFGVILTSPKVTGDEKKRTAAYLPLFLLSGIYFGFLFQKFT